MNDTNRLWKVLATLLVVSFGILLYFGREIYLAAPPMPSAVVATTGQTIYSRDDIETGRQVWQSIGGQQLGSVWGHGSYVAPDWSADWLHREATAILDAWALRETGKPFAELDPPQQSSLRTRLAAEMRGNTYDPATGVITVSADRAAAIAAVAGHYTRLFSDDASLATLRSQYAIRENPIPDSAHRQAMTGVLLLDSMVDGDQSPQPGHQLHQQLAVRTAGGQRPDDADLPVDLHQHPRPAGRRGRAHLVLRRDARQGARARDPRQRSARQPEADAVDEGHRQVFLGGDGAVPGAGHTRRHHRALRGRRPGILRIPARQLAALHGHAQLAPADRGAVDRHRVAGHGPLHRAGDLRPRTEVPATRRQFPVHLPAGDRDRRASPASGSR